MTVTIQNVAFDCADPYALAQFWSRVTGQPLGDEDAPGDPETSIDHRGDGAGWAVLAYPEGNEFCVLRGAAEPERAA